LGASSDVYAIIAIGGKQLKVHEGDTIRVELLPGEVGETVTLTDVLLVHQEDGSLAVGTPTVKGASVTGNIIGHGRGDKITIFKHKRRKNYRRKQGHRQPYTALKVTGIDISKPEPRPTKKAAEAKKDTNPAAESAEAED
jgi:large subunit ribosomal protein L21